MDDQKRVLIVEDSEVLCRLVSTCFRDRGWEFVSSRLPRPGRIDGFVESDLVIIGVYIPFGTALEVIRRIKRRAVAPPIFALTTDSRRETLDLITAAGADAIAEMPFQPQHLRAIADRLLGG